jgi:hypothetical protein
VLNLTSPGGVSAEMQRKTIAAIRDLNQSRLDTLGDPEIATRIASYELAFRMQSAAPELLDFSSETKETLELYGVNRIDGPSGTRGGGVNRAFAVNCLLARRLIERGVRVVNLFHASWDHHSNLDTELSANSRMADQPLAALLKDLKRRGMLDDTMVVWASEFGRTPLGENRGGSKNVSGRDHHPFAYTLWLAGGGIRGGQTIGKTDDLGWSIVEDPIHVHDLHATMLHLFGFDHEKLNYRFQGLDFRLTGVAGNVVRKLLA